MREVAVQSHRQALQDSIDSAMAALVTDASSSEWSEVTSAPRASGRIEQARRAVVTDLVVKAMDAMQSTAEAWAHEHVRVVMRVVCPLAIPPAAAEQAAALVTSKAAAGCALYLLDTLPREASLASTQALVTHARTAQRAAASVPIPGTTASLPEVLCTLASFMACR